MRKNTALHNGSYFGSLSYKPLLNRPLSLVGRKEIAIDLSNHTVFVYSTGSYPLILHACGKSFSILNRIFSGFSYGL